MVGYIYLITDTTNGKQYVGQHHYHLEKLDSNYHGSGVIIKNIYKKRPETLKEEYIKTSYTQTELDEWEQYYIEFYNTLYPNGYNLTKGGDGCVACEEICKKISEANKGRKFSEEHIRKLSVANKGKQLSEETRRKISESTSGEKNPFYGRQHSEESKNKISKAKKGKPAHNKGKSMSEEQKKKMSKKVLQFTLDGEFIREWPSTKECGRNGFSQSAVCSCCNGKKPQYKGFKWCYA